MKCQASYSFSMSKAMGAALTLLAVLSLVVDSFLLPPSSVRCCTARGAPHRAIGTVTPSSTQLSSHPGRASVGPTSTPLNAITLEEVGVGRLVLIERPHDARALLVVVIGE